MSGIGRSQLEKNWKEKIEIFSPMGKCLGRRENQLYCLWNLQVSNCWNRMLRNECIGGSSAGHVLHFFLKGMNSVIHAMNNYKKIVKCPWPRSDNLGNKSFVSA